MTTKVVNRNTYPSQDYILVDRSTPWGNPYKITNYTKRIDVIKKHALWFRNQQHLLQQLPKLKNKILACHCTPLPCHADLYAVMADLPELVATNYKLATQLIAALPTTEQRQTSIVHLPTKYQQLLPSAVAKIRQRNVYLNHHTKGNGTMIPLPKTILSLPHEIGYWLASTASLYIPTNTFRQYNGRVTIHRSTFLSNDVFTAFGSNLYPGNIIAIAAIRCCIKSHGDSYSYRYMLDQLTKVKSIPFPGILPNQRNITIFANPHRGNHVNQR